MDFCRKLMADQAALAAKTASMEPGAPPNAALDQSYAASRRMCQGLTEDASHVNGR